MNTQETLEWKNKPNISIFTYFISMYNLLSALTAESIFTSLVNPFNISSPIITIPEKKDKEEEKIMLD